MALEGLRWHQQGMGWCVSLGHLLSHGEAVHKLLTLKFFPKTAFSSIGELLGIKIAPLSPPPCAVAIFGVRWHLGLWHGDNLSRPRFKLLLPMVQIRKGHCGAEQHLEKFLPLYNSGTSHQFVCTATNFSQLWWQRHSEKWYLQKGLQALLWMFQKYN